MSEKVNSLTLAQRMLLAFMLLISSLSLYFEFRAAVADAISLKARWQIPLWQQGKTPFSSIPEWSQARNDLVLAMEWTPGDPMLYEQLGYLYGLRAFSLRAVPELEGSMLNEAKEYFRTATTLRPMSPFAWANLALALHLRKRDIDVMWQAFDRAYQYGNREAGVQIILAEIACSRWKTLDPERQEKTLQMINGAQAHSKGNLVSIAKRYDVRLASKQ